jgi:hypothetical protein
MSNFVSNENKAFIWQMLMESNAFRNISNDKFHQITLLYEKIISEIAPHTSMNLIEKNKLLMSKMVELLATIKMERRSDRDRDRDRLQPVEIKMDEKIVETEYINLVNHNKPKEISFNEKIDKPFNPNELNTKLNEIINSRSYDIPTPQANKLSDKKVAFAANIESIEEVEVITIEKVYTLLQTMAKKQDTMIELLTNLKRE